ncbi:PAS domain-containing protein [Haloarchaeobius baliensis]|uniref:PAS domain-containing protein n=1 Tax=Haloarchaeobius baliensis TaxID=1670458 RepID=UPI003F884073
MTPPTASQDVGAADGDQPPRLHLFMTEGEDRRLLVELLEPDYELVIGGGPEAADGTVDCCLVDGETFRRERERLVRRKELAEREFFPVLLLAEDMSALGSRFEVWQYVDDIVELPVRKSDLRARLANLLQRRETSTRLAERERTLEQTVAELQRKERAMDAAPVGITITDPTGEDNPTVYANEAFERITGYDSTEVLGRNMRFLQGPATDESSVTTLREGIEEERAVDTTLVNYRHDGTRFWNRVEVAPVYDEHGRLVNYVGFQTDVTDEKVREQRLAVLNRVMRHNLSNDINVIEGYADILLERAEDDEILAPLEEIQAAAKKLEKLGDAVSRAERTLDRCRGGHRPVLVDDLLTALLEEMAEQHPEAELTLDVEDGPWQVVGNCLDEAFFELLENAVVHNDSERPTVAVTVRAAPETVGHVEVRIRDDGPGIPGDLVEVFREGEETPLHHSDGLGLWIVHWVVTLLGGTIRIDSTDETTVSVTLPTTDHDDE